MATLSIAVVAPGGSVDPEKLAPGLAWLRSLGANAILGMHVYDRHRHFAGTRHHRFLDLEWALTGPAVDAVWFARGGSGTAQLLDLIPWDRVPRDRRVIGFSDATALLVSLARHGIEGIHGPVLTSLATDSESLDDPSRVALQSLLFSGVRTPLPGKHLCGPTKTVHGPLIGGNLTVLASLSGTAHAVRAEGAILVLEDVREAPYRLERSLVQLLRSGNLDRVAAVALGEFKDCRSPTSEPSDLRDLFVEHLRPLDIPVIHQIPVGHGSRNLAFPYGVPATLTPTGIQFAAD